MKVTKEKLGNALIIFQFFIQKCYTWQNNTFDGGLLVQKITMWEGYAERNIK